MGRSIDPASVVWIAPESLAATPEQIEEAMAEGASGEEIAEMARPPQFGEFRVHVEDEITEGNLIVAVYSDDRLVWVDDAPDDNEDGSGHYEVFDEAAHGWGPEATYRPSLSAEVVGKTKAALVARGAVGDADEED
jgi:hypothetical protein